MGFNPNQYGGGGDFEVMPKGRYLVRLNDVTIEPNKDGSDLVWRMQWKVIRGPFNGRIVFSTLGLKKYDKTIDAKRKKGMYTMGWKFAELFNATNFKVEDGSEVNIENKAWVRDAFIGAHCAVILIVNGKWNNVDQFLPLLEAEIPIVQEIEKERLNSAEMNGISGASKIDPEAAEAEGFDDDDIPF